MGSVNRWPRLQRINAEASKRSKRACRAARYSALPDPAERATRILPRAAYRYFEDDTLTVLALMERTPQTRAVPSVPVNPGTGQIGVDSFCNESDYAIGVCQLAGLVTLVHR